MQVDADRLWQTIQGMGEIGKTPGGGSSRLALSDEDIEGRKEFLRWVSHEGCYYRTDVYGNIFVQRTGNDNSLKPVVLGSHLDTQPRGGKFDGVLGVLSGLEVIRVLNEHRVVTKRPIEIAVWTNEEGSRFSPAMSGSAAFAGLLSETDYRSSQDAEGNTLGECLDISGFKGDLLPNDIPIGCYLELHIEQGPILEERNIPVAVVNGVQGVLWLDIHFYGESAHAGPTPMANRKDALFAASDFINKFREETLKDKKDDARFTVGNLSVGHPSRNVVPSLTIVNVDIRHVNDIELERLEEKVHCLLKEMKEEHGVEVAVEIKWKMPVLKFNDNLLNVLSKAVSKCDVAPFMMMSGAGHDAANISRISPTAMLFVPSVNGISHNEREFTNKEHCALGAQALLNAVLDLANNEKDFN
tara:strand:- start:5700 stop:6941 length:1242 start_codon:yes stop_codon:yes gene_type:complete